MLTNELIDCYRILGSPQMEPLLKYWRMRFSFDTRTTLVQNDPLSTAFNEGKRIVWRSIVQDLQEAALASAQPLPTETE